MHSAISPRSTRRLSAIGMAATILASTVSSPAARQAPLGGPDFTKGDAIPQGATHDWTLGASGARGWIHSENLETSRARQILITEVAQASPAEGVLQVGDVILGIGQRPFSHDPRVEFGKALTAAESSAGQGKLSLLRWRAGKSSSVNLQLPVLGDYSATAPYDCAKSQRILEQGCKALAKTISEPGYRPNPISRSLNALALLASGDAQYLPVVRKEARWAADYSDGGFKTWYYGYVIMFLSEYVMATGDDSMLPGLRRLALESAKGQSIVGSWGHGFAGKDGRLAGYGMMNAPGVPLTISLVMARQAGVADPELPLAIERSAKLLRFYIGKGAVPYGDHHPWIEMHEDNGKCGMAAVLFNLLEEPKGAEFFSRMSLAAHGSERDTGHTGNFWNMSWAMPGVNQSGPQATGAWMKEFGAWSYDLARRHDGTFRHQGPPQMTPDHTHGWDATGAYLLAYAMPLKKLMITGRKSATTPQLDAAQALEIIEDGRGWSNAERHAFYDQLPAKALMQRLGNWSPIVRQRAAEAIARRGEAPVEALIAMLDHPALETRLGACQAIEQLKGKAAAAVPALRQALKSDQLWLRVKAADALAAIGEAARPAAPEMLRMLARGATREDPRAMEQRYLSFALFNDHSGLLSGSLEGIDHELLMTAVESGLQNQDGRARLAFLSVYRNLPAGELEKLLPAIHKTIVEPSPSGIMFADGIRLEGLKILSKLHIAEGIDAAVFYLANQNSWASEKRTPIILEVLRSYGAHARRTIPELERIAAGFAAGKPSDFPMQLSTQKAADVRETIEFLKNTTEKPELRPLK